LVFSFTKLPIYPFTKFSWACVLLVAQYRLFPRNNSLEARMAINVLIKKTGPYVLSGDLSQLEIADADGNKVDISGRAAVALCRCGASTNKPFCDGTHSKIGFLAAEAAVKKEG
jgi:3-phenylpropionate/trans-cinnamate dioxygenase ferredoxin subunit